MNEQTQATLTGTFEAQKSSRHAEPLLEWRPWNRVAHQLDRSGTWRQIDRLTLISALRVFVSWYTTTLCDGGFNHV